MTALTSQFSLRCGHFQKQQWEYYVTASWVPYHKHYQVRDTIIPPVQSKGSPPRTFDLNRLSAVADSQNQRQQKKTVPWLSLAQAVSAICFGVVANRRQPNRCHCCSP